MKCGKGHEPLRSCVVCGNKTTKRELVRVAATPQGAVAVDHTGRLPGRGAYVCADGKCARGKLRKSRVEYALRKPLTDEEWAGVTSSIEAMVSN
jgi:predicted RNA-binding protein YlxR (DUF448 family)